MDVIKILEITATLITLLGITIISIPRRIGIHILIVGSVLWTIFSLLTNHNFLLIQSVYVLFFDVYAVYSWKKKGIN